MQEPIQPPDELPLPPMETAQLDADELSQLFTDLAAHATISGIMVKDPGQHGDVQHYNGDQLVRVHEQLRSDPALSVQLRYAYDGHDWIDTIRTIAGHFKLTRMRVHEPPARSQDPG